MHRITAVTTCKDGDNFTGMQFQIGNGIDEEIDMPMLGNTGATCFSLNLSGPLDMV